LKLSIDWKIWENQLLEELVDLVQLEFNKNIKKSILKGYKIKN
jgi:hypothetical protein